MEIDPDPAPEIPHARGHRRPESVNVAVVSGPTAVGKGTVVAALRRAHPEIVVSRSATTRPPRPGERDGVEYDFVTDSQFDRLIADGGLLEWAVVHNSHRYGTPRRLVDEAVAAGRTVVLEIDMQGARQVRESYPRAEHIFLTPPSWEELKRRLIGRGTETPEQQARRLRTARKELAAVDEFDAVVVNDTVDHAVESLVDLLGL
ncbi:guanylate kinase [Acidipropionibacterium jensenii]|uniref:Guanylate kinase n=1 Tax=Acidipropionibacterium jensenii TaxID=1749 RepID=A0A3S4V0S0_9ACTN|nr:guanylate kinase [Acidipropionibacterium jensenii]AZZ42123.1 guanylate kinase [Acidipropionibacterium jensenii]QCV88904.1 guanylate kinase [Acidipropionibacterium jensenii]VEI02118.1 Guanylate kinase [Acidipropionibacterium jensenii]